MSTFLWLVVLVALGGIAIHNLLNRVSELGGTSHRTASEIVDQVRAETDAYRGSRTPDNRPWDGQNRIAPPISDGSGGISGG